MSTPRLTGPIDPLDSAPVAESTAPPRRRITMAAAALLAASLIWLVGTAPPASAWQRDQTEGRTGAITSVPSIWVTDAQVGGGPVIQLSAYGAVVNRVPRTSAAQDVQVLYLIERWTGSSWVQQQVQHSAVRIPAGVRSGQLPILSRFVPSSGYYRVTQYFSWTVAGTNRTLGYARVRPNLNSDHRCGTTHRPCATGPGWARIGNHVMFGGGWGLSANVSVPK